MSRGAYFHAFLGLKKTKIGAKGEEMAPFRAKAKFFKHNF